MDMQDIPDVDPQETQEWLDALEGVIRHEGAERAQYLLDQLVEKARRNGAYLPFTANTAYCNTIPAGQEERSPGDHEIEDRIRAYVRWNAMAMVVRANKHTNVGGHIASFASAATLYDVGYNHFWRAPSDNFGGDMVFVQGHSAPGVYARAFLLGRLSEEQMDNFRQEVDGKGLSSYPRFMRYLRDREIIQPQGRKVWAFMGDGEMDEPESLGAISLAGREKLDNLVFVINCNLQRLDGPVRGNSKIIQELEANFRGAGWNVIKVIWGGYWDTLFARDTKGLLMKRLDECVDGEFQTFKSKDGAYVRKHFFGKYPELLDLVSTMSDDDIWRLNRGGHDPHKVYAAYAAAVKHTGQPTVILAKTIKGYGMGEAGESQNITHQQKKMGTSSIKTFRDRFNVPVPDEKLEEVPYLTFEEGSPELTYMRERRAALGGYLPARRRKAAPLDVPPLSAFDALLKASGEGREMSTTMAFVRILTTLVRDKKIGKYVVPIVPDESRTFGMEGMFRQLGIYSHVGQLYTPQDAEQLMFYKEDKKGQILEEGITEAGSMSSFIAAGTAYATHGVNMIPFYIYYSMFGFQRIGDQMWLAGDIRAKGFLLGATYGRTTLNGEGLQHQDGHSLLAASTIPTLLAYDPAFGYEVATIIADGIDRMYSKGEEIFYYLTLYNEKYPMPPMPEGSREGILKGLYKYRAASTPAKYSAQIFGSGPIILQALRAQEILAEKYDVAADVWSATNYKALRIDAQQTQRWNMFHPTEPRRVSYLESMLSKEKGPFIAVSDNMKIVAEQIAPWVPGGLTTMGTDGFGRSETRANLRRFFEVDAESVVIATLYALAQKGQIEMAVVGKAIKDLGVNPEKVFPTFVT